MQELSIVVKREYEDAFTDFLIISDVNAFEVVDSNLASEIAKDERNWDYCDIEEETTTIVFKFYMDENDVDQFIDALNKSSFADYRFTSKKIEEKDYENDWKAFFKTIVVSDDFKVVPVWETYNHEDIVINPGMAFGTGSHETTFLCLKEIARLEPQGTALDIGTGSGILAIALAKKYGAHVDAYEIDELAIKSANENAKLNGVSEKINIYKKDFSKEKIIKYDFIVSNIFAETLVSMMPAFAERINTGGKIVFSGIIKEKMNMVIDSMQKHSFKVINQNTLNDWAQLTGEYIG